MRTTNPREQDVPHEPPIAGLGADSNTLSGRPILLLLFLVYGFLDYHSQHSLHRLRIFNFISEVPRGPGPHSIRFHKTKKYKFRSPPVRPVSARQPKPRQAFFFAVDTKRADTHMDAPILHAHILHELNATRTAGRAPSLRAAVIRLAERPPFAGRAPSLRGAVIHTTHHAR